MDSIISICKKFGMANIVSYISLLFSITAFVMVARLSYQDAINKIDAQYTKNVDHQVPNIPIGRINNLQKEQTAANISEEIDDVLDVIPIDNHDINENAQKIAGNENNIHKQYRAQIGTFTTHSEAVAYWFQILGQYSSAVNGLRYTVHKQNNVNYLHILSSNKIEAEQICMRLAQYQISCKIVLI